MTSHSSPSGADLYADNPNALPAGTRLGEFELLGLLGVGGFGIVYRAFDHALEREVAVKEYMPASLAGRTQTMHVSLRSQSDADTFALGLKSFVNEARLLARFDHPSLLKVYRFWEGNGTAYMAMPILRGQTLKEVRLSMPAPPDETWLRALLKPLLEALEKLHSAGVYHRDIAPDNIQIEPGGRPVLLDFGAARRVISDKSQTLTAILKPAYAPIEQYAEAGAVKQGPWTDIYALGATLHFMLMKRPPAPATTRTVHDEASGLTQQAFPMCSGRFLRVVDWMLAPRPNDRPQNINELRAVLDADSEPPAWRKPDAVPQELSEDTVIIGQSRASGLHTTTAAFAGRAASSAEPVPAASTHDSAKPRSKAVMLAGSALAACAALGVLAVMLWQMSKSTSPAPNLTVAPAASVAISAGPVPASAALPTLPAMAEAASSFTTASSAAVSGAVSAAVATAPTASATNNASPADSSATAAVTAAVPAAPADIARPLTAKDVVPLPATDAATLAAKRQAAAASRAATKPTAGGKPLGSATVNAGSADATPNTTTAKSEPAGGGARGAVAGSTTSAAPESAKSAIQGPEQRCANLSYFKNLACMERECRRGDLQSHADCQKWYRGTESPTN
jgi:serine/threonine protein kinase